MVGDAIARRQCVWADVAQRTTSESIVVLRMNVLVERTLIAYRKHGLTYILMEGLKIIGHQFMFSWLMVPQLYYRIRRRAWRFKFNGKEYPYFVGRYGQTWRSERTIEIPIALDLLNRQRVGSKMLEVGNVLSNYFRVEYDIVDKYDIYSKRVVNCDITDFKPASQYDLIISISTMEHVGFDYPEVNDSTKSPRTIESMRRWLTTQGVILITIPLGHNAGLDKMLFSRKLGFTGILYMKRVTEDNKWVQVEESEVRDAEYGSPFKFANAVAFCIYEKTPVCGLVS